MLRQNVLAYCEAKKISCASKVEAATKALVVALQDFKQSKVINDHFRRLAAIPNSGELRLIKNPNWVVDPNQRTICTVAMESTEEIEAFQKALPGDQFQFAELIPMEWAKYDSVKLGESFRSFAQCVLKERERPLFNFQVLTCAFPAGLTQN